jgi:hypothetical protein
MTFTQVTGDWTRLRQFPDLVEVDFHRGRRDPWTPYENVMADVHEQAFQAIKQAYETGKQYVLFTHGRSTSRPGQGTARSVIRKLMRSKNATPYIDRRRCQQHESVFLAGIRRRNDPSTGFEQ